MKTFEICVLFALFAGTLAAKIQYIDIANDILDLESYKSGIYFAHKGPFSTSTNGIIPMYQKISNNSAFYGIFQYNRNKFAVEVAVKMFKTALALLSPIKLDSRSFLEEELKKIDDRLMQDDIIGIQAESETKALIAIVGPTTVTVAEVGDMGKALYTTNINFFKESLSPVKVKNPGLLNVLGGKAAKAKNSNIRGMAEVMQFTSMKWIVLGTKSLSSLSGHQIKRTLTKNANDLKIAAQKITKLIKLPKDETDCGVIVIDGRPMERGEQCVCGFNMGLFKISSEK